MVAKNKYRCTDCGREIPHEGTCPDCLVEDQPEEGKDARP